MRNPFFRPKRKGVYEGDVVFVNGAHHPVRKDGTPEHRQKLRWDASQEVYLHWDGVGADHLGLYHQREVELPIGGPSE